MLKVWAILVFWGLLAPSQGLDGAAEVIASITANGLEKIIADQLSGGDILKSVLGAVSRDNGGLLNLQNLLVRDLRGLEITNLTLPEVSLKLLPGVGVQLNVYTKVSINGKGLVRGVLRLQAEVNIVSRARLVQNNEDSPKLIVEDCKTKLTKVLLLPLGDQKNVLNNILSGMLCPLIDAILNTVNTQLHTVNSVVPLGVLGNIQYTLSSLPVVSDGSIKLDLNAVVNDSLGNIISDPNCSAAPISLPLVDSSSQLALSGCLLTSVLRLLLAPEKLNTDIIGQMLPASIPETISALGSAIPQVSELQPLLKIKVLETTAVSLQNGKVTVRLPASIDLPQKSLFGLRADVVLSAQPTIADNKLHISLTLESINLRLTSSQIDEFNVTTLEPLISSLLRVTFMPRINAALDVGIPLPNLLNLNLENGVVKAIDNALVINALN